MQVSKRFLALLDQQLAQFTDRPDLQSLVVYLALPGDNGKPALMAIGQWPANRSLPTGPTDTDDTAPLGDTRRWLALRDQRLLLGALRVDSDRWPWPESLRDRLEATAQCLSEALKLDVEQQRLGRQLAERDEQLKLLVHQLRTPLDALRTCSQLLKRRLAGDPQNQSLVDNLLVEQGQIQRYVEAIDGLADQPRLAQADAANSPRLLPPGLNGSGNAALADALQPLLERAAATAHLQGRPWQGPLQLPSWHGDASSVGEIVANLLENAFRYSPPRAAVGLHCQPCNGGVELSVWDGGDAIPLEERQRIFAKGERGSRGSHSPGSGLGLALAEQLARELGGELELLCPPQQLDLSLPAQGNAFRLRLPASAAG
jgi:signal transduction histidine kinase